MKMRSRRVRIAWAVIGQLKIRWAHISPQRLRPERLIRRVLRRHAGKRSINGETMGVQAVWLMMSMIQIIERPDPPEPGHVVLDPPSRRDHALMGTSSGYSLARLEPKPAEVRYHPT